MRLGNNNLIDLKHYCSVVIQYFIIIGSLFKIITLKIYIYLRNRKINMNVVNQS